MVHIDLPQIEQIILKDNQLFIPDVIEDVIIDCLEGDLEEIWKEGKELLRRFSFFRNVVNANYVNPITIDAYSLYYLRRNCLIPRIAFRDIVRNQNLQQINDRLHILDLGSGTGAVSLGLLEMFTQPPLENIEIELDALDISSFGLERLKKHIDSAGLSRFKIETQAIDLCEVDALEEFLKSKAPYDFIFAANLFNEIGYAQSRDIVKCISKYLNQLGFIIIVSAAREYTTKLHPLFVDDAINNGLYIYYPCQHHDPSEHQCWFWRGHEYRYRGMRRKDGHLISGIGQREELVAIWLMICNQPFSIFDGIKDKYPDFEWGVFRLYGNESNTTNCEICTGHNRIILPVSIAQKDYHRGSLVGLTGDPITIAKYYEL